MFGSDKIHISLYRLLIPGAENKVHLRNWHSQLTLCQTETQIGAVSPANAQSHHKQQAGAKWRYFAAKADTVVTQRDSIPFF